MIAAIVALVVVVAAVRASQPRRSARTSLGFSRAEPPPDGLQIALDDVERATSVVRGSSGQVVRVFDPVPRLEVWKSFRYQRAYAQGTDGLYVVAPDPNGHEVPAEETAEHLFLRSGRPVLGMHHLAFNVPATRYVRLGDPATFADPAGLYAVVSFDGRDSSALSAAANQVPELR